MKCAFPCTSRYSLSLLELFWFATRGRKSSGINIFFVDIFVHSSGINNTVQTDNS